MIFSKIVVIILCLCLCLSPFTTYATDYYVDNSVEANGNGLSWATAWKNFSNKTGLKSGDIIYISGGSGSQTYYEQITMSTAGVTIRPGGASSDSSGHDGTVIIDPNTAYGFYIGGNNITIDGNVNGERKFKVTGIRRADRGASADAVLTGITVRYVETIKNSYGIFFNGATGEIDHNYIHDMDTAHADAAIAAITSNCTGVADFNRVLIHDNVVETPKDSGGSGFGTDGVHQTCGVYTYHNIFTAVSATFTGGQHSDCIQTIGTPYHKLEGNTCIGYANYSYYFDGCRDHCYAINNYAYNSRGCITIGSSSKNEVRFDNNTCIDWTGAVQPAIQINVPTTTVTNSSVRNNIVMNVNGGSIAVDTTSSCGSDVVIDNNITVSGTSGQNTVTCNGSNYNQPTYSSTTQPTFVDYTEGAGASNDMHLGAGDTIAKDHGADLSAYINTDILGNARPNGAAFDIGAYEYYTGTLAEHTVTPSTDGFGSISPSSPFTVLDAASTVITLIPNHAYKSLSCSGTCGTGTLTGNVCVTPTISGDCTMEGFFTYDNNFKIVVGTDNFIKSLPGYNTIHVNP